VLQPADVNKLSDTIVAYCRAPVPEIVPRWTRHPADQLDRRPGPGDRAVITNLNTVLDSLAGKGPELDALIDQSGGW